MKRWHLLHINPNLAEMFQNPPILAFLWSKNPRDITGTKLIKNSKVKRKFANKIQGKRTPCLANSRTLCCKQVVHITLFRSDQTNRIFQIYRNLNCKSKYVIYLLECSKYKIQYVGKTETDSILNSINTERMYRNQMPYLQAVPFQAKAITLTLMRNSYWLNRYATLTLPKKKVRKG